MKIFLTGHKGFIGKNLIYQFRDNHNQEVIISDEKDDENDLTKKICTSDFIIHLAGINISDRKEDFMEINFGLTKKICRILIENKKKIPIIFSSSVHVDNENSYGQSKLAAEKILEEYSTATAAKVHILRLPHIFGKWCKPNYNSVVATFCNNVAKNIPIEIFDGDKELKLVYIDDLINSIFQICINSDKEEKFPKIKNQHSISVNELANLITSFENSRKNLLLPNLNDKLIKSLYSTYISYFTEEGCSYALTENADIRGKFVEILKSDFSGQISYFTINPNQIRGGHYHHSKTEKFFVITGEALFRFRNIITNEKFEINVSDSDLKIIDTIPGWSHDVVNKSKNKVKVLVWANELFDNNRPDTIKEKV